MAVRDIHQAKALLIEEISAKTINILKIRELCRDTPGLIASAGLRIKIWTLLLLGGSEMKDNAGLINSYEPCGEMHVLEADVKRTRASIDIFKSTSWRRALTDILQVFCVTHRIQYKQGMNEVAAPFLYLNPPPNGEALSYVLFEAFIFRYLENFFCRDESTFLFKAFRLFHLLLVYVDPQLAHHLEEQHFLPELYSPQWFLTLYSRGLSLPLVLRLWDMMIAVDDPAFTFFVGLALLRSHLPFSSLSRLRDPLIRKLKDQLLLTDCSEIPEIISGMAIKGEQGVDELVLLALDLYRSIPRCFIRYLRVCCVRTPELTPLPPVKQWEYIDNDLLPSKDSSPNQKSQPHRQFDEAAYAHAMARQSVRQCLMLSPAEFISILSPISPSFLNHSASISASRSQDDQEVTTVESTDLAPPSPSPSPESVRSAPSHNLSQMVVLDIRSAEEIEMSGGGSLPTAMQIEPGFLDHPDALERWLEHFDSMKGLPICIIDMPPAHASAGALWKRLLLGEGDGLARDAIQYGNGNSGGGASSSTAIGRVGYFLSGPSPSPAMKLQPRDDQSPFLKMENTACAEDSSRVGVRLANVLQAHQFPSVMVLDGGFPSLVTQLWQSRGSMEPVIINHDHDRWVNYLVVTGRLHSLKTDLQVSKDHLSSLPTGTVSSVSSASAGGTGGGGGKGGGKGNTELEHARVALEVATRLGHVHMRSILEERIERLLLLSLQTQPSQQVQQQGGGSQGDGC